MGEHPLHLAPVLPEVIEREGLGPRIHLFDGSADLPIGAHGQERAEDFLLHDPHLVGGLEDERRPDPRP
jgi:hypothetical protein